MKVLDFKKLGLLVDDKFKVAAVDLGLKAVMLSAKVTGQAMLALIDLKGLDPDSSPAKRITSDLNAVFGNTPENIPEKYRRAFKNSFYTSPGVGIIKRADGKSTHMPRHGVAFTVSTTGTPEIPLDDKTVAKAWEDAANDAPKLPERSLAELRNKIRDNRTKFQKEAENELNGTLEENQEKLAKAMGIENPKPEEVIVKPEVPVDPKFIDISDPVALNKLRALLGIPEVKVESKVEVKIAEDDCKERMLDESFLSNDDNFFMPLTSKVPFSSAISGEEYKKTSQSLADALKILQKYADSLNVPYERKF